MRLQDFKTIGTWRWQGCQPYAPAAFTPGNIPGIHFCYRLSRPQGHSAAGGIMSPSGIDPATFRFVARCLNLCATASPRYVHTYIHKLQRRMHKFEISAKDFKVFWERYNIMDINFSPLRTEVFITYTIYIYIYSYSFPTSDSTRSVMYLNRDIWENISNLQEAIDIHMFPLRSLDGIIFRNSWVCSVVLYCVSVWLTPRKSLSFVFGNHDYLVKYTKCITYYWITRNYIRVFCVKWSTYLV
jgi:hypothetical protein